MHIDGHRDRFGVVPICRVLADAGTRIAPSTHYTAKARPPSAPKPRGRGTVKRLMRAAGVQGIRRDKTRKTTFGEGAETSGPADLRKRALTATAPNQP